MAYQHQTTVDIQKLIERSEKARDTITAARLELKNKFDIAARIREVATSEPAKIVGGSLLGGFVLKKLFFRGRKRPEHQPPRRREISHLKKERGILLGLLGLLMALAKPVARMYASKLLKDYLKRRLHNGTMARRTVRNLSGY